MKRKREKTKIEKMKDWVREFFAQYRFGIDFWALGLFVVLMLPTVVWWCWSPGYDILRKVASHTVAMDVFAYIFQGITVFLLVFVVKKERGRINVESAFFLFTLLSLFLYYAAWVFYFCAYVNIAVLIFMAVFPCTALGCYAALRKNWLALVPVALFFALHLASTLVNYVLI